MPAAPSASSPTSRWCWPACSTAMPHGKLLRCLQHPDRDLRRRAGLPAGTAQEYGGLIKHGAKLLFVYSQHRAAGHHHHPQGLWRRVRRHGVQGIGADMNYAWPTAQVAVMGAKGAGEIIFRSEIGDPDKIAARTKEYEDHFLSPFIAAERLH
ncbi:carboxyl transferase domain-containing protein [Bradyrhizobium ottawaense]